jgi:hypothetical protein
MRKPPTQQALKGLRRVRDVAAGTMRPTEHHPHPNPAVVAAVAWLDDLLKSAHLVQEWVVSLETDGCAECLGEHPDEDGVAKCTVSDSALPGAASWAHRVLQDGDSCAPLWCKLRRGTVLLVRGE